LLIRLNLKKDEQKSKTKMNLRASHGHEPRYHADAYAEIIFDIKSGDIIRGYGNGGSQIANSTPKGDFTMFGAYEFERGNYNFTLYDIITRNLVLTRQSHHLVW